MTTNVRHPKQFFDKLFEFDESWLVGFGVKSDSLVIELSIAVGEPYQKANDNDLDPHAEYRPYQGYSLSFEKLFDLDLRFEVPAISDDSISELEIFEYVTKPRKSASFVFTYGEINVRFGSLSLVCHTEKQNPFDTSLLKTC